MNLTPSDLRRLPFAGALISKEGDVIAATPEWHGSGPGAASYPVRRNRLVVCVETAAPRCADLLERLLHEMDAAGRELAGPQASLVRMLTTSLRLVAGRSVDGGAVTHSRDVLQLARCGIEARTGLDVHVETSHEFDVPCADVAALILVQLAANAERHDGATAVTLVDDVNALSVRWHGAPQPGRFATARRHDERTRWGLGFARIAADAIGAVVHTPRQTGDAVSATVELQVGRLTLPLAAVRDHRIVRATRAWDEETGALPGSAISALPHARDALAAASASPGIVVRSGEFAARSAGHDVWFAVPPDDVADRARDVIEGLTHERALIEGIVEPRRSRINALAQLLAFVLGAAIQRVPTAAWTKRMRELSAPFGLSMPIPDFDGVGVTDPAVCALLAAEAGDIFEVDDGTLWIRLRRNGRRDPVATALLTNGSDRVRLG